jgi:hypothetical protein
MKRMQYRHIAARLPKPSKEIMPKRCTSCSILLDVPCLNPVCEGHQNDSIGDRCRYCATNQREALLYSRDVPGLFFSSLGDLNDDVQDKPRHQFVYTSADASRLCRSDISPEISTQCFARVQSVFCFCTAYSLVELRFL